jgi:hypothetical protein
MLVILTVVAILSAPTPEAEAAPFPSTYNSTSEGARAAFLLLQRLGMSVQRWEEPPFRVAGFPPAQTTLIFAAPAEKPSRAERAALKHFVENGGRVLFCGKSFLDFFPELIPKKVEKGVWATTYGAGELIRWQTATALTNSAIRDENNLTLFLNSVGVGSRQIAIWDEYFHGERGSLWDYIMRMPAMRWALLPTIVLIATILFTYSRRRGPVIPAVKISRLSPLEFVESLGILYRRAKAAGVPVEVNSRELRLQLLRKLGLPVDINDADIARQAAVRLGWNESDLLNAFTRARSPRLSAKEALELVQVLKRFTVQLVS